MLSLLSILVIISAASRDFTRKLLSDELQRVRAAAPRTAPPAPPPSVPTPLRSEPGKPQAPTFSMVKSYMFDQSAKFVKIYISSLPGIADLPEEGVVARFEERSLQLDLVGLSAAPPNRPRPTTTDLPHPDRYSLNDPTSKKPGKNRPSVVAPANICLGS